MVVVAGIVKDLSKSINGAERTQIESMSDVEEAPESVVDGTDCGKFDEAARHLDLSCDQTGDEDQDGGKQEMEGHNRGKRQHGDREGLSRVNGYVTEVWTSVRTNWTLLCSLLIACRLIWTRLRDHPQRNYYTSIITASR